MKNLLIILFLIVSNGLFAQKYLELVPIEQFGGNPEWRGQVHEYHARIAQKRHAQKAARQG